MGNRILITFAGIVVLFLLALWAIWPGNPESYFPGASFLPKGQGVRIQLGPLQIDRPGFKLGLDLVGGTHLLLQADMSKVSAQDRGNALTGVIQVIQRRINAYGVSEPVIQAQGDDRVIVELPGVKDVEQAISLIGKTAQMDFREQVTDANGNTTWV